MERTSDEPMGGNGMTIEADEKYIGKRNSRRSHKSVFVNGFGWISGKPIDNQKKVVSLVERGGEARSFHVPVVSKAVVKDILTKNADLYTNLMTDESNVYPAIGAHFLSHQTVNHSKEEYVRGRTHTNTVEGFFSALERGLFGTYQCVSSQHLQRYLTEFDFRYSHRIKLGFNDLSRTTAVLKGAKGKRLTYREPVGAR